MKKIVTVVLLWFFGTLSANAQVLWREVSAGMSPESVRLVLSEAVQPTDGQSFNDGTTELLRISSVELAGQQCSSHLFFNQNKLSRIVIRAPGISPESAANTYFNKLLDALRSKYGQEMTGRDIKGTYSLERDYKWKNGRTTIALNLLRVLEVPALISVSYSADLASTADKL